MSQAIADQILHELTTLSFAGAMSCNVSRQVPAHLELSQGLTANSRSVIDARPNFSLIRLSDHPRIWLYHFEEHLICAVSRYQLGHTLSNTSSVS
jgi:hypothetical protein